MKENIIFFVICDVCILGGLKMLQICRFPVTEFAIMMMNIISSRINYIYIEYALFET